MEREELKEIIIKDLNSKDYPFVVEVKGNTVVGRWKTENIPEGTDEKELRAFAVKYHLRKDGTFGGGEMTLHRTDYTAPMNSRTKTVFSVSSSDTLPWRKKVAQKDWKSIGYDAEKLYSIMEHYLMDRGFFYKQGAWSHAYISWNDGYKFRAVGGLFVLVGLFLSTSFMSLYRDGLWAVLLFLFCFIAIGVWLLLIGLGKVEFYSLQPRISIRLIFGFIIACWLLVFALVFLEHIGIELL